jgi:hypothetical protein
MIKLYLKYFKDLIRAGFNTDGDNKFSKIIIKKIKKGNYLDVGCYHPFKESQTVYLYKKGWRGVNLDISKDTIKLFDIFRKEDKNLHLGLSIKNGKQYAYFEKNISTLSSLDKNHLGNVGRSIKLKKSINVIKLKTLRKKYNLSRIDFIKLDCENLDEQIINKSGLNDLNCIFLSIELLPQTQYGWKNFKLPKKNVNKFCRNYFIKSKIYKKLKRKFTLIDNNKFSFLLRRKFA